jgi:hypothetical protein
MTVRPALLSTALLLTGVLVAAPALRAQGVEYAPGTTSYRVTTMTKGTQSSPMGNQAFEIGVEQRITVDVARRAKDTLAVTVTIDSISLRSADPTPDVSQYRGLRFVSLASPTGRVYSTKGPERQDPLITQLSESIARFLPAYRREMRTGMTWADTTTGKVMQQGLEVDRTSIATYVVRGDTSLAGEKAFKVNRHMAVTAAGSGSPAGNAVAVQSSTTSDTDFFLSQRGVYLGGSSNDDISLKLTIVAQNAEINIKQNAVQTVTPIR